ncbi:transcription initiation factor TFIID subunit 7 isoform X2 [Cannabis sativa]|uniref:transcription initiation factor TFIID subunit 7 isoform X1 n=1 Tax=Cannabis sativa TaxID=3483 RepID=UPI0029CA384F|nr:transcription initiation factor TFIID subunit 7 isoform X1 [Cannabis sativa]XP_060970754.1 transcription initiation factor TFIID subunit 7 isoform X2 [Cannabis sativa]
MEEQFILRVPPSVAERIERLLNEDPSSSSSDPNSSPSLDLSFTDCFPQFLSAQRTHKAIKLASFINFRAISSCIRLDDGRTGTFVIGNENFPASLLDLPCVVESYKTYDDSVLIKTADVGQMIMVREPDDPAPDAVEYRHGLTPPMRDARKRRFRREPDLNPELVRRVEDDLLNISAGGHTETVDVEVARPEKNGERYARDANKKSSAPSPVAQPDDVPDAGTNAGEPDRSDSDDSDDSG